MDYTTITAEQFDDLDGYDDWRYLLNGICADFRAGSFTKAAMLTSSIAEAAELLTHHPDIDIRYPDRVRVRLITHATGGLTTLDLDLAKVISELAVDLGAAAEPESAHMLEVAIDALDIAAIRPFWAAVMGYVDRGGELTDPVRGTATIWFQQMDEPRPQRNRVHLDVIVPHDIALARVAAAVEAGGTLLTDEHAPSFWVLADAEGSEVCVCTWQAGE